MKLRKDNDWGLVWVPLTKTFHFVNRKTGAKENVTVEENAYELRAKSEAYGLEDLSLPTPEQTRVALEAALESGRENAVAQLLTFNTEVV
ncbi:uncharacterized protein N0V89_001932 [Didymosphaeria variabile]|uniref:Uncharacterized protein n=1 Tax=Didymosphaeria variabile TaxID=1932322 RepID=A0A9W8XQR4_9PLEO|nr:uncharacterized protein N0V89_001932 [Didymosphaeria variabile]KAJ4357357.1 hypothetical protein N0V89_001932 [Didymosphaeria variabile]